MLTLFSLILLSLQLAPRDGPESLNLPTPRQHYEDFDQDSHARELIAELVKAQPGLAATLPALLAGFRSGPAELPPDLSERLAEIPWEAWEQDILEQLLHRSRVLEMVTPELSRWRPFVHDSLLYFLHRLGPEEVARRFLGQLQLSADARRGTRALEFSRSTPLLQKIGQILARNQYIPEDFRSSLQRLENSIRTLDASTLIAFIESDVGPEKVAEYQLNLDSTILAEASVGAVIAGFLTLPGEESPRRIVCKVIKPGVREGLHHQLQAFDALGLYLQKHGDFYELGEFPLADLFDEIRDALSREILVLEEQHNLARAAAYYADHPHIEIPTLYELSTPNVTVMDFVKGVKVSEAFPDDPKARARVARRLSNALTYDVLFNRRSVAIFHGDPHAGNVFHVTEDDGDGYRLALLDWGLLGEFTLQERQQLVQLVIGIRQKRRGKIRKNIGVLIDGGLPDSEPERERIDQIIEESHLNHLEEGVFVQLQAITTELAREGYGVPFQLALFVKSQVTISGILHELDPELKQDRLVKRELSRQVMKEFPKRILYTFSVVGWNSRDFDSLLSNADIFGAMSRSVGGLFAKAFNP